MSAFTPPLARIRWKPCYRVIPSRFPPVPLFARVAAPKDFDAVFAVEALTNARLREEAGASYLVAPADRVSGPGSSWIMAPFTHISVPGGRFSTSDFGAYYAARSLGTAIAESAYHRARFLRATKEPPIELDMRVLHADLAATLHDVRGLAQAHPPLYDPESYSASQAFAARLRAARSSGIVYDSVRHRGGKCVAVFRPTALSRCKQAQHLSYMWDGTTITQVYEKSALER